MFSACAIALVLAWPGSSFATVAITECGQTVPKDEHGIVQNDVHCDYRCSGDRSIVCAYDDATTCERQDKGVCGSEEVVLEPGAVLSLNGHAITAAFKRSPILCGTAEGDRGRCTVKGPGRIDPGTHGVVSHTGLDLVLKNLTIEGGGWYDVAVTDGRVTMSGVEIRGGYTFGIRARRGITLVGVAATPLESIESDGDIVLDGVELGGLTHVATPRTIRGRKVVLHSGSKLDGHRVLLRGAMRGGDETGPVGEVRGGRRVKLVDSEVATMGSGTEPQLVRSTCQQSYVLGGMGSWQVCTQD
jgi:hypothetical protein